MPPVPPDSVAELSNEKGSGASEQIGRSSTGALLDKRFIFVVGKGGVGKTAVAAALAWQASQQGKKVLVALCNAKDRLTPMLGGRGTLGSTITEIASNLWAVNMTPEASIAEYGRMIARSETLYRTLFDNKIVRGMLHGTPGVETWSMLGKAYYHAERDMDARGHHRFDLVIVDAPATGHAIEMLRVPRVLLSVAPGGVLLREAQHAIELFEDAARSAFVIVTLPEELPVTESIDLGRTLRTEFRAPIGAVVVNRVAPDLVAQGLLQPDDVTWLRSRSDSFPTTDAGKTLEPPLAPLIELLGQRERHAEQIAVLRSAFDSVPIVAVDELANPKPETLAVSIARQW